MKHQRSTQRDLAKGKHFQCEVKPAETAGTQAPSFRKRLIWQRKDQSCNEAKRAGWLVEGVAKRIAHNPEVVRPVQRVAEVEGSACDAGKIDGYSTSVPCSCEPVYATYPPKRSRSYWRYHFRSSKCFPDSCQSSSLDLPNVGHD